MRNVPTKAKFGSYLRRLRTSRELTLRDLATALELSTTYVSDVELGHRPPFAPTTLRQLAKLLGTNADELIVRAAESRGAFELEASVSPKHRATGAALMRAWARLSEAELAEIKQIVEKEDVDGDEK